MRAAGGQGPVPEGHPGVLRAEDRQHEERGHVAADRSRAGHQDLQDGHLGRQVSGHTRDHFEIIQTVCVYMPFQTCGPGS